MNKKKSYKDYKLKSNIVEKKVGVDVVRVGVCNNSNKYCKSLTKQIKKCRGMKGNQTYIYGNVKRNLVDDRERYKRRVMCTWL